MDTTSPSFIDTVIAAVTANHETWTGRAIHILAAFDQAPESEHPAMMAAVNDHWGESEGEEIKDPEPIGRATILNLFRERLGEVTDLIADARIQGRPPAETFDWVLARFVHHPASPDRTARFANLLKAGLFPYVQIPAEILAAGAWGKGLGVDDVGPRQRPFCRLIRQILVHPTLSGPEKLAMVSEIIAEEPPGAGRIAALGETMKHLPSGFDPPAISIIEIGGLEG